MRCYFVDNRPQFVTSVASKLGSDFEIEIVQGNLKRYDCDVVVIALPSRADPEFVPRLQTLQTTARNPAGIPVVALLNSDDQKLVRIAIGSGAYDYIAVTDGMDEFRAVLLRAVRFHVVRREFTSSWPSGRCEFESIITANDKMLAMLQRAAKMADSDATILITGETGTGKEVLAKGIHSASSRASRPFVPVACAALPESLLEAELFGHERGAFTGANTARQGRFEAAGSGTAFIDEVGDLPPAVQLKLLRVLQERSFERLGSNEPRRLQARVICATHRDLRSMVASGSFRADLFYRLNTLELHLPPLRERVEDIRILAHAFMRRFAEQYQRSAVRISPAVITALEDYEWPGNVRELEHVIEHAVLLCEGPEVCLEHLPAHINCWPVEEKEASLDTEVRNFKRRIIHRVLVTNNYNKSQAARLLQISRTSLHRLIYELNIPADPRTTR
jgi:DNA-binding NtrC family response regulator